MKIRLLLILFCFLSTNNILIAQKNVPKSKAKTAVKKTVKPQLTSSLKDIKELEQLASRSIESISSYLIKRGYRLSEKKDDADYYSRNFTITDGDITSLLQVSETRDNEEGRSPILTIEIYTQSTNYNYWEALRKSVVENLYDLKYDKDGNQGYMKKFNQVYFFAPVKDLLRIKFVTSKTIKRNSKK